MNCKIFRNNRHEACVYQIVVQFGGDVMYPVGLCDILGLWALRGGERGRGEEGRERGGGLSAQLSAHSAELKKIITEETYQIWK